MLIAELVKQEWSNLHAGIMRYSSPLARPKVSHSTQALFGWVKLRRLVEARNRNLLSSWILD